MRLSLISVFLIALAALPGCGDSPVTRVRAELGDTEAQLALAEQQLAADAQQRDPAAALRWLERAADAGSAPAQARLALLYESGDLVDADPEQALVWLRRAGWRTVMRGSNPLPAEDMSWASSFESPRRSGA
jgi:hypothetical protein